MPVMSDERSTEEQIAALRELLESTGWKMLLEYANDLTGPIGYSRSMQHALASIPAGPDRPYELMRATEQIQAVAQAVTQVTNWPAEALAQLTPKKHSVPFEMLRRVTR
jgi:hypothetical protein